MTADHKKPTLRWGGSEHFECILVVRSEKLGKSTLSQHLVSTIVGRPVSRFLGKETLNGKDESTHTRRWPGLACLKTSRFLKLATSIVSSLSILS